MFRKGGYLSKHENRYYDDDKMEVVNKYHYIGFAFTTLSVKQGTGHLVSKGKNAVFSLSKKCREMTKEFSLKYLI